MKEGYKDLKKLKGQILACGFIKSLHTIIKMKVAYYFSVLLLIQLYNSSFTQGVFFFFIIHVYAEIFIWPNNIDREVERVQISYLRWL